MSSTQPAPVLLEDILAWPGPGAPRPSRLPGAVAASLLLHAGAVLALFLVIFRESDPVTPAESAAQQSLVVTLVRRPAPPGSLAPAPASPAEAPAVENPGSGAPVPVPVDAEAGVLRPQEPVAANEPGNVAGTAPVPDAPALATRAGISAALSGYVKEQEGVMHRDFVAGCLRHRNRDATNRDCPENVLGKEKTYEEERDTVAGLFASITRSADHARLGRKLEAQNDILLPLTEKDDPAGEQARIRFGLNQRYLAYLNGNAHELLSFMGQTAFVNDYGRTTGAVPYQFRCKESPCVYRYRGFTVKRPAAEPDDPTVFRETTPLFLPSKD